MSKSFLLFVFFVLTHFFFGQNVGIGTNSPLSKLHVAGTIRSDTLIGVGVRNLFTTPNGRIYDSLVIPSALSWEINGNANITAINFLGTTNATDVIFKTNSIERARFLSTGNFGIGTISPLEKLHVNGNILANDGVYAQSSFNVGYSSSTVISDIFQPWTDNGIKIYDGSSLSHLHVEALGHSAIQSYGTTGSPKPALENTAYSALALQDKGGNVGIGTIAPGNKLEINSTTANTSGLRFTNLTSASPTVAANGKALSVDINGDVVLMPSAADAWRLLGNAGTTAGTNFLGTTDAQDLVFKTNNVEHVRTLASNGYVGVGNPAPTAQLDVFLTDNTTANSIARFSRVGTGSQGWFSFFSGAAASDWNGMTQAGDKSLIFTNDNNPAVSANSGLIIAPWTTAGNPAISSGIKIMENGNVGITVGAPTKKLEISSDANAALYATRNFNGVANSDAGFIGGIDASYTNTGVYFVQKDGVSLGSYATNLMNVVSNGVPKVVVNGTGNMRIGNQFYNTQNASAAVAPDAANVKFAVMGGYSAFGSFNSDPAVNPAPVPSWINGVGALVTGMNRISGTSNVDFWNATDPGNGAAALTATDRGFNWRNFNLVAGNSAENSLMTLNGLGNLTISGTNYFTSDKRLKTNVKAFENNILAKVMKLQPGTYQKHSSGFDASGNLVIHSGDEAIADFGFLAQEVYEVFPELVNKPKNEAKELWSVDYSRLSVMLTKAMQEQQQVIESQEQRIQRLEKALAELLEKK
jgi:polyhydroxyalkanoate synthesis regulator phasin